MARKTKEIRIVLVGCGGMSRAWLRSATALPGVSVVGLVDVRREAAEQRAQEFNLPVTVVFDSLKQALDATKPDAVFDVTIPAAHREVTITALRAGCHVLGEKPMAEDLRSARAMVAAAARARRLYAVIQNRRYQSNVHCVRKLVQDRKLGGVEEAYADFFLGPHFGGFRDAMDYPLLVDMAIHTFDQARFIAAADPVSVYCHSFNPQRSWYKGDASAVCIFEMKRSDGQPMVFTYRGSWCAEGLPTSWESQWRFVTGKGTVLWDGGDAIRAEIVKPRGKPGFMAETISVPVPEAKVEHTSHDGLIREFVDCIRTGMTPQTICTDNIKSLAMVLAAVESAKTGKKVKVRW